MIRLEIRLEICELYTCRSTFPPPKVMYWIKKLDKIEPIGLRPPRNATAIPLNPIAGTEEVVVSQLAAAYDGTFEGGKSVHMNAKNKGVGLDMKNSVFQYFNQTLYDDIYKELAKGELEILSAKDAKTIDDLVKAKWLYYIRIDQE